MKKIYFLLLAFSLFTTANAQIITFPDANFKAKLLVANVGSEINEIAKNISGDYFKIDANNDGEIQESEALQVSYLNLQNSNSISSLDGIDKFTNLTYLDCVSVNITSLDLIRLSNLRTLKCGSSLTTLDLTGLKELTSLEFSGSLLTNLNLTGLNKLENLSISFTNFTSFDFSTLSALQNLSLNYNSELTSLNLIGLNNLKSLNCNINASLKSINITGLNNLLDVLCTQNGQLSNFELAELSSLKTLNFKGNSITSLNLTNLTALKYLDCSGNKITSLNLTGLDALEELNCSWNSINNLNLTGLSSIKKINCEVSGIINFNLSGLNSLISLYAPFNQFSSLNLTGLTALEFLDCSNNKLSSLDLTGLNSLKNLETSGNQLTSLDLFGVNSLEGLGCSYNQLASLDLSNLSYLKNLSCSNNQLTSVNFTGLNKLENLECSNNKLTNLNLFEFKNLKTIGCSQNQLTNLNLTDLNNIRILNCFNNQLTSLNFTGLNSLENLDCSNNHLTSLELNESNNLVNLRCQDNNLGSLFIKNGLKNKYGNYDDFIKFLYTDNYYYDYYDFSGNPNLKYICADEKDFVAIQDRVTGFGYTNCHVNSYCSFAPGGTFYTIQGNQKIDVNKNSCDANDIIMPNLKYSISDGTTTGSFISNTSGNYSIPVQAGTYTITPKLENPTYFIVSPTTVNLTFPTQTSPFTQNFCITPNGVRPDLEVTLLPLQPARPGFDAKYKLVYKNKGNTIQSGAVNLSFTDSVLDLVVANPIATSQTTNNLSWNFTNLQPFATREITFTMNVNSPQESPAVINGDILAFTSTITSVAVDETPADNTFTFYQTVVGSYDPNDKTCLEGAVITPALIGQYVHYTIRFENTGTFAAENVVVKDMIDLTKFDISTLVPTSASHSYFTRITEGNKVEFIFENINLPFDDANNDGYIAFKIKTKSTLVVNDTFSNEANIYFDYNFPILTNKATSTFKTLGTQDFDFDRYFTVYPNPAKDDLNISAKETINVQSMGVYNTLGQLVLVITNADKVSKIDVSSLTAGNYFVQIKTDKGSSSSQFVKD